MKKTEDTNSTLSFHRVSQLNFDCFEKEVKLFLQQAVKAHRVVRNPPLVDNQLIDGSKFVSRLLTPQENCWYSFLLETESTPGS
jgi:hypothetical protein